MGTSRKHPCCMRADQMEIPTNRAHPTVRPDIARSSSKPKPIGSTAPTRAHRVDSYFRGRKAAQEMSQVFVELLTDKLAIIGANDITTSQGGTKCPTLAR